MAIQINLEKYGHKKKGYLSFSWTSLFFNFLVPLFRLDIKWFFIFISPYLFLYIMTFFIIDSSWLFILISSHFAVYPTFILLLDYYHSINHLTTPIFIMIILIPILRIIFSFIYNDFYTKGLLKEGYLPPEEDEYSNAILKGNRYLEYTKEDLLDKEKLERYRLIIEEYQQERKKDLINFILIVILLILLIALLIYI